MVYKPDIDPFSFEELKQFLDYLQKNQSYWYDLFLLWKNRAEAIRDMDLSETVVQALKRQATRTRLKSVNILKW